MKHLAPALFAAGLAGTFGTLACAQPTIDGSIAGDNYGTALAVQNVQTQFGDASPNGGSEIDAAYAQVVNNTLYLTLTGNIENNFNKYFIFFDSVAGGQNSISATNNPQNFDSRIGEGFDNAWDAFTNRGLADSPAQAQAGSFTFDTGFEADYAFLLRRGSGIFDLDYAIMDQTAIAADEFSDVFLGFDEGPSFAPLPGTNSGETFEIGYDNSNTAGVAGGTQAADQIAAAAVQTGVELAIPLSALGNPTGDIRVSAFVNGSNGDFLSNQFLGSLQPVDGDNDPLTPDEQGNLGSDGMSNFLQADRDLDGDFDADDDFDGDLGDGGPDALGSGLVNLNNFAGNQFFTISLGGTGEIDGDYNDSGLVEQGDLDQVLSNWGAGFASIPGTWINQRPTEGIVDQAELDVVLTEWGSSSAPSFAGSTVPEPAALALLGGLGVLGLRRRVA